MKLCISTGISTFLIVLYCCIGIDFLPEFIDEELMDHPLFRFVVLALMALVFCYDHYIAILIGFSYMLTKFTLLPFKDTNLGSGRPVFLLISTPEFADS